MRSEKQQDKYAYAPRTMRANRAAAYLDISTSKFLELVSRGRLPIGDLSPAAVRAMRDSIKIKTAPTTADACVMVVSVLWKFASEFCQLPLDHNPAHGVARVHTDGKSHEPWPDDVIDKLLAAADAILRLAVYLLLYTGQREGDVVAMKWDDIRAQPDGTQEIFAVQQKTGTKVWIPLHRDLKVLLGQTPRVGKNILNSSRGKPFASSQSLYQKTKDMLHKVGEGIYTPHGLRATAAIRLIEAGCSEDQAAAITRPSRSQRAAWICARSQSGQARPPPYENRKPQGVK